MTEYEYLKYKQLAKLFNGKQLKKECEKQGILFDAQDRYDRNIKEYRKRKGRDHNGYTKLPRIQIK